MPKPEPEAATKPRFVEAKPTPSETTEKANTNQAANPSGPAGSAPSAVGMRDDSTKAQNDTRPPPEGPFASTARTPAADTSTTNTTDTTTAGTPTKIPGTAATTTDKPDEEQQHPQPQTTTDPLPNPSPTKDKDTTTTPAINLDGPGPRPLEEIAREHGGDAAGHQRRDSGKGIADEEEGGEKSAGGGAEGTGEGTGEEYVKSSGLRADGGDFDAARPGAGREADREFSFSFFFFCFSNMGWVGWAGLEMLMMLLLV